MYNGYTRYAQYTRLCSAPVRHGETRHEGNTTVGPPIQLHGWTNYPTLSTGEGAAVPQPPCSAVHEGTLGEPVEHLAFFSPCTGRGASARASPSPRPPVADLGRGSPCTGERLFGEVSTARPTARPDPCDHYGWMGHPYPVTGQKFRVTPVSSVHGKYIESL